MDQQAGSKKPNLKLADKESAKLGGWMRLWIVGSGLWSLGALLILLVDVDNLEWKFVGGWLAPPLFVLALGWALGWAFRPFIEKLKPPPPAA